MRTRLPSAAGSSLTGSRKGHYHQLVMPSALPELISPADLARRAATLSGSLSGAKMGRLRAALEPGDCVVGVDLRFELDERERPCILGSVSAEVRLTCQRCLEPLGCVLASEVALTLVGSDREAAVVDSPNEPLQVGEGCVSLSRIVEDELLLALPMFPSHARGSCGPPASRREGGPRASSARTNPFAVLENLKLEH